MKSTIWNPDEEEVERSKVWKNVDIFHDIEPFGSLIERQGRKNFKIFHEIDYLYCWLIGPNVERSKKINTFHKIDHWNPYLSKRGIRFERSKIFNWFREICYFDPWSRDEKVERSKNTIYSMNWTNLIKI